MVPPRTAGPTQSNECRQCCTFCDRVVHPTGCIEAGCPYLYLYDEEDGRRFMGCMNKVFRVEIDVAMFEEAERTRQGFGGVRMTGPVQGPCRWSVERAYQGDGDAFACVNPGFFEAPEPGAGDETGFDLRDSL